MLPNVPPKPLKEQVLDHDKLEYPLVPTSVTQRLKFPSELPQYFNELSTAKLQELARSPDLLQSYLYKTSNFDQIGTEIVESLEKQIEYTTKLLKNVKEDIVPQTDQINKQLEQFHEKLKKFDQLQVRMYDLLNKYSRESIIRAVERSVNDKDRDTKSLVDQIRSSPAEIDEAQLASFMSTYTTERQEYYLKLEKLHRLYEERVGGLETP